MRRKELLILRAHPIFEEMYATGRTQSPSFFSPSAMRLNSHRERWLTYYFTLANPWMSIFTAAMESAELDLQQEPDKSYDLMYVALVYGFQEQNCKATATVAQLKERFPAGLPYSPD